MSLPGCFCLLLALVFVSCESPHEKISRLQSELLTALGERDSFEIVSKKAVIRLPLPPAPELAESRRLKIEALNRETESFDRQKLTEEDQKRLTQLSFQLKELAGRGSGAFFDPVKCVLADVLNDNSRIPDGRSILLSRIPDYYAEVERRWQAPDPARARVAAEKSLQTIDLLKQSGENSLPAQLAVKDFIGLCRSTVLSD